jgi:hypothetical protein
MSLSPSQSWTLTELARLLDKDSANVLRELAILQEEGYVSVGDEDKKTYRFNQQSFIKQELQALFLRLEEGDFSQRMQHITNKGVAQPQCDKQHKNPWPKCA